MQRQPSIRVPMALVLVIVGLVGCSAGGATSVPDDLPLHLHVVCPARPPGQACEEAQAAVEEWVRDALARPQSTFTVWTVGADREHAGRGFTACVPLAWGPNVLAQKAAFVEHVRVGGSGGRDGGSAVPPGCVPPGPATPGRHQLRVAAALAPPPPEGWPSVAGPSTAELPLHQAVVCDRSNSTATPLGMACDTASLVQAFDQWVAESHAAPGASLAIVVVGASRDTARLVYTLAVPERVVGEKVAFVLGARAELTRLLADRVEPNASAIAEAVSVAVSGLRERVGQYRLLVLSDLRQVTPGRWNFEQAVPPAPRFVSWLRQHHLDVELRGVPILACGLHHGRGPDAGPYSARLMMQTRDTWDSTFRAMGATEVTLVTHCEAALAASR